MAGNQGANVVCIQSGQAGDFDRKDAGVAGVRGNRPYRTMAIDNFIRRKIGNLIRWKQSTVADT